jgi:hypothetical protein
LELESKADEAYKIAVALDEPHERMREDLVCLVEEFGSTHAEKSKLLHGLEYEIIATFGISTSIDATAAKRFAQGCASQNRRSFSTVSSIRRSVIA